MEVTESSAVSEFVGHCTAATSDEDLVCAFGRNRHHDLPDQSWPVHVWVTTGWPLQQVLVAFGGTQGLDKKYVVEVWVVVA